MSYQNAEKVLPMQLLKEVQRYAAGKMLYVPSVTDACRRTETPYQREMAQRNRSILRDRARGCTVSELAQRYYLSEKSIERILRKMKKSEG